MVGVDTLWTGLSGLILFCVLIWLCVRYIGRAR